MPDTNRRNVLKMLAGLGAAATAGPMITSAEEAEDRFIVNTGDEVSTEDRYEANGADVEVVHDLEHVGYLVVRGPEEEAENLGVNYSPDVRFELDVGSQVPDELTADLEADDLPGPEEAKERLQELSESEPDAEIEPAGHEGDTGNLPFSEEFGWDVDLLNLDEAHNINRGTKPNGDPVRIGIIDDGVYQHDHLNVNAELSVDLTGDSEDVLHPNEEHYHGTHVAGISASAETGVAPEAEIVSMRYFSTAGAFFGDFAAAVNAAIVTDCDVINASLGFTEDQPEGGRNGFLRDYIENYIQDLANTADQNGIVWVASAGNSANNANDLVPGSAKADNVLSVSSTAPTGMARPDGEGGTILGDPIRSSTTPASYTTHGREYVDVSAPGGGWNGYGDFDLNRATVRDYIAPDGVLSSFPPDTFGASLLLEIALSGLGTGSPLPGFAMYGQPFPVGEVAPTDVHAAPYLIFFSDIEGDLEYDLYYSLSLAGISSHVNPDTVTDDMTFVASFDAPDDLYGSLQGTSMAAPQVAGVAALLQAEHPDWSPREIRRVIKATAREVGKNTYHGHGLVDPVAALEVDDPADVRGQIDRPENRDDRGRNERAGGSPRDASGGGSGRSGRDDDEDDEEDDSGRGRSRGDDDDDDSGRGR